MIGVVWTRKGRVAASAGPRARAVGRRSLSVGPRWLASVVTFPSVVCPVASVPGSSRSEARMFASWEASARKFVFDAVTNDEICESRLPSSVVRSARSCTTCATFLRRFESSPVISARSLFVGSNRLNVCRRSDVNAPCEKARAPELTRI